MNNHITQQASSAWIGATVFGFLTSLTTAYVSSQTTSVLHLQFHPQFIIAWVTLIPLMIVFIPLALVHICQENQRVMNIALALLLIPAALPIIFILGPLPAHIYLAVMHAPVGVMFLAAVLTSTLAGYTLQDRLAASLFISLAIVNVALQFLGGPLQSLSPTLSILITAISFWMWIKSLETPQYRPQGVRPAISAEV